MSCANVLFIVSHLSNRVCKICAVLSCYIPFTASMKFANIPIYIRHNSTSGATTAIQHRQSHILSANYATNWRKKLNSTLASPRQGNREAYHHSSQANHQPSLGSNVNIIVTVYLCLASWWFDHHHHDGDGHNDTGRRCWLTSLSFPTFTLCLLSKQHSFFW